MEKAKWVKNENGNGKVNLNYSNESPSTNPSFYIENRKEILNPHDNFFYLSKDRGIYNKLSDQMKPYAYRIWRTGIPIDIVEYVKLWYPERNSDKIIEDDDKIPDVILMTLDTFHQKLKEERSRKDKKKVDIISKSMIHNKSRSVKKVLTNPHLREIIKENLGGKKKSKRNKKNVRKYKKQTRKISFLKTIQ
jgi:hypothetical protein